MCKIPNDELGRYWLQAKWNEGEPEVKQGFGVLFALNEEDELAALGHAVIIHAAANKAICLGAAHSFEEIKRLQQRRTARFQNNVSPIFRSNAPEYIKPDGINAVFIFNGDVHVCTIEQLNYQDGYDVAVFTVRAEKEIFNVRAAIDFAAPRIGDEVAVVANAIDIKHKGAGASEVDLNFSMMLGVVTEVSFQKSPIPGQSYTFKTTIPILGGMSGSALVRKPTHGESLIVIGIVSSDISPKESFKSFLVPGISTASMLWPFLGLVLEGKTQNLEPHTAYLAEWREKRIFDDRTEKVEIAFRRQNECVQLLYIDMRDAPPAKYLLEMPAHPLVTKSP